MALLAILLIAIVPTISQLRAGSAGPRVVRDAPTAPASAQHHAHGTAAVAPVEVPCPQHDHGGKAPDDCWKKCGYCDFLAHAPLLVAVAPSLLAVVHPRVPSDSPTRQPRYARYFEIAQARGPPNVLV